MTISVALCTFNGAAFLAEQLQSICQQTRPPDEVVVCDDASSDRTSEILGRFSKEAPFPVAVKVNPRNLGSTANFAQAIGHCAGDLIVLSDQDDIWLPAKLEVLERTFAAEASAGFAWSDAEVVDERQTPLGYTLWNRIQFQASEQEQFLTGGAFELLLKRFRVTGATMAFRAAYRDLVLPIPTDWVHDGWIAQLIAAVAPGVPVAEPLVRYRQHPGQQIGERRPNVMAHVRMGWRTQQRLYEAVASRFMEVRDRLRSHPAVPPRCLELLAEKIEHFRRRASMRGRWWRVPDIWRECRRGHYSRYSLGWKSVAQDLFLP
jgi:glycosyltransferase involved in cell wall biosynthesis